MIRPDDSYPFDKWARGQPWRLFLDLTEEQAIKLLKTHRPKEFDESRDTEDSIAEGAKIKPGKMLNKGFIVLTGTERCLEPCPACKSPITTYEFCVEYRGGQSRESRCTECGKYFEFKCGASQRDWHVGAMALYLHDGSWKLVERCTK